MTGSYYLTELEPYQTVFTLGMWNSAKSLRKLYVFFCLINKSLKTVLDKLLKTSNISIERVWIL